MTVSVKRMLPLAALLAFWAAFLAPDTVLAQSKKDRQRAREHFQQAEAFMKVKVYDKAIEEYRAGYELMPSAHGFLFNIGLAYESMGDSSQAIEHYRLYLKRDPKGKKRAEARARAVALERRGKDKDKEKDKNKDDDPEPRTKATTSGDLIDIEDLEIDAAASEVRASSAPADDDIAGASADSGSQGAELAPMAAPPELVPTPAAAPAQADTGVNWRQVGIGAGLFTLGLLFDSSRSEGYEGNLGDIIAIGLYGSGGYFVIRGVF